MESVRIIGNEITLDGVADASIFAAMNTRMRSGKGSQQEVMADERQEGLAGNQVGTGHE
jgi:hypothetical protein